MRNISTITLDILDYFFLSRNPVYIKPEVRRERARIESHENYPSIRYIGMNVSLVTKWHKITTTIQEVKENFIILKLLSKLYNKSI